MGTKTTVQNWTTRSLLAWMTEAFTKKGLDSPRLMAELLMGHVAGCERMRLYMDADRPASPLERDRLRDLVGRALKHEPVQYLVGEGWFYGLPMHVSPAVLIPRPCTETLVEQVLLHARAEPGFGGKAGEGVRFADVCAGSGSIAIALLKQLAKATGLATDISGAALEVCRKNAERHKVADRLEILEGDLLAPLEGHAAGGVHGLHYLVSNPPYIPDSEWNDPAMMGRNVKGYEPEGALRGGPDGLTFVRPLIERGPGLLRAKGLIAIEVAAATAREAAARMREHPMLEGVRIVKDLEGLERVVIGARRE